MSALTAYDKYLSRLLLFSFFLPIRVQVFVMMPICAFFAFRDVFGGRASSAGYYPRAIVLAVFYLLYLAAWPFTADQYLPELGRQLEYKASLILMPLVLLLMSRGTRQLIREQLIWFVPACVVSCVLGNVFYLLHHGWPGSDMSHVGYRLYFEDITGVHPTYMGMYIAFAIAILWLYSGPSGRLKHWMKGGVYFVLLLSLFALLPKTPVIALAAVLAHFLWFGGKREKLPMLLALAAAALLAWLLVPFSAQRIDELSILAGSGSDDSVASNSIGMRQLIWKIDTGLLRQHWLWGLGPGRVLHELAGQYLSYSIILKFPVGVYDTHNQYFDAWLSFGIFGLLLFLAILGAQFYAAIRSRDRIYLYFLIIVSICFLTENLFSNQHGVVFYAFFTSLFFLSTPARTKE